MKKIFLDRRPDIEKGDVNEKVIALGYFDGVHLGHQQVIKRAVAIAAEKGYESAVMTFTPHPSVVLRPSRKREDCLTPMDLKAELIERLGADLLIVVRFDRELSQLSPQQFVDDYLIKLHAKHIVAGYDFTFGRMARGNMSNVDQFSRSMFGYTVVPKVERFGEKVSTSHIRKLVKDGNLEGAAILLGRPYQTMGKVVHGDRRGRTLGFPTANIAGDRLYVQPGAGIYAVRVTTDGKTMNGVGCVGTRPTFYNDAAAGLAVEVYVMNFSGDLYDREITVDWYKKLRDEVKFADADALIEQMKKDERNAAMYFESLNL
ncbi:MAG: bifunctional riboflavin kinase/FAD synthetase [Sporolactobacillus sp.]|nr:bifunctional riboflavin kinase/FAD synthetase [Sporolactobacillus sp.]